MSSRSSLLAATGGMAAVTLVSRLSGWARDKVVASLLGAGIASDAFLTGFRIPNLFRAFLAEGSLHAAFVPTLTEFKEAGEREKARAFVAAMTSALMVGLAVIVAAGVAAAPWLVRIFAEAFYGDPARYEPAVLLTRLMFPYLGLISLAALAQGVLNTHRRFLLPAATPILLNLCIAAGTYAAVTVGKGRLEWMAVGVVVGGVVQLAVQWPTCRRLGIPLLPGRGAFRHPGVRQVLRLMVPGVPALGVYQLTILLSNRFAAATGEGGVTFLYNASRINELVYGVVVVQLVTAVFPTLSEDRARDPVAARETFGFALRILSLVALPSAALTAVLALPMTGVLFGGGKYVPEMVAATAGALAYYALGMPFLAATKLLATTSYAWKDTVTPLIGAAANLAVFFAAAALLAASLGVKGVALAASLGQVANAAVLVWRNAAAGRLPRWSTVVPAVMRHGVAAAACTLVLRWLMDVVSVPPVTSLAAGGRLGFLVLVGGTVYAAGLAATGASEWRELAGWLRRRRKG